MQIEKKNEFIERINSVEENDTAQFGKMNVKQMICHCSDQFRMMFGEVEGLYLQQVDLKDLREKTLRKETVPTVDGLDQCAGKGTKPTELENDKNILISYLNRFFETSENFEFSFHPYFGVIDRTHWNRLVVHHLDHYLSQFGR